MKQSPFTGGSDLMYTCILKIAFPNYTPQGGGGTKPGKNEVFTGELVKEKGKWAVFIDKYIDSSNDVIERIMESMNEMYVKMGSPPLMSREGKYLVRTLIGKTQELMNRIIDIPGVIIFPVVVLHEKHTIYGFSYPRSETLNVSSILLDYLASVTPEVEILYLGEFSYGDPFGILNFLRWGQVEESYYKEVTTIWEMTKGELQYENAGIFQNRMLIAPKYFGDETPPIVAYIYQDGKDKGSIKGNCEFREIARNDNSIIVEFHRNTSWFTDAYKEIVDKTKGSLIYMGYSDGKGILVNYQFINKTILNDLFKGLRERFNDPRRVDHRNYVNRVLDFRYDFDLDALY